MNYLQSFIEASESLLANKMRSGLTVLGIIIGVAAVIAVLAIGNGTQELILGEIQGVGTNLLFVMPGGSEDVSNPKPLTLSDAEALADPFSAPSIAGVAPVLNGRVEMNFSGETKSTTLVGVTPDYSSVRNVDLSEGEFFSDTDLSGRNSVVLLGTDVAEELFGRTAGLVGEKVRIEGQPFRVVGVLAEKGGSAMGSEDNQVLVPMTTAQTRLLQRSTPNSVDVIYIQAVDFESVPQASLEVSRILSSRHRTMIGEEDFSILSQQDFLDLASTITGVLTIFLGGIAAISLLVGGIGIMNIMMVSVVERTQGDRAAQSPRCPPHRYPQPVPDRIFTAQPAGWSYWHPARLDAFHDCRTGRRRQRHTHRSGHVPECRPAGRALLHRHRHLLRAVSRQPRLDARTGRSPALRIARRY